MRRRRRTALASSARARRFHTRHPIRRTVRPRRDHRLPAPRRPRAGIRTGANRERGPRLGRLGRLQARDRSDVRAFRGRPLRRLRHRGDLRAADLSLGRARGRGRRDPRVVALQPGPAVGAVRLRARQGAARSRGAGLPHRSSRRDPRRGRGVRAPVPRRGCRDAAHRGARRGAEEEGPRGRPGAGAALGPRHAVDAPLRPGRGRPCLGLDARARAAAPPGYDRGFALSDHADWPALLRTIDETGAGRVLVSHGYSDELVRFLLERGQQAEALATAFEGEADA